jgi:hypothetical protein
MTGLAGSEIFFHGKTSLGVKTLLTQSGDVFKIGVNAA